MQKLGGLASEVMTDDERFKITVEIDNNIELIARTYFEAIPEGGLISRQDIHNFLYLAYGHVGGGQAEIVFNSVLADFRNNLVYVSSGFVQGKTYRKT